MASIATSANHRTVALLTLAASLALVVPLLSGCEAAAPPQGQRGPGDPPPNYELRGKVDIDGSSTVFPIIEAAASRFRGRYPNVSVNVGVSGTGGGFKRFIRGEIDISDASRPIDAHESAAAIRAGIDFIELPIAYDGLTIVVHNDNDWVDQLSIEEIRTIYSAATAPKSWAQVRSSFPDRPIQPFAPGTDSGTFEYFREVVIGKTDSLRPDMSTSEDDNVLVTGVAGSSGAIGFFGAAYYEENRQRVKAVAVVDPRTGQPVMPSPETIEAGLYAPLSRPLFIYVTHASATRPEVNRFVEFFLDQGPSLAAAVGYVALPPEIYQAAIANFRARNVGTHYVTTEGEKRGGPVMEVYQAANRWDGK